MPRRSKAADIGVAMGAGGTDVARRRRAMVLTDDNFASIEAVGRGGRGWDDNLVKFVTWTLPTNFGEGLVIVAAILAGATSRSRRCRSCGSTRRPPFCSG